MNIEVKKIEINWNEEYSIFSSKEYLKELSENYGWLGGYENKELSFILPYIIKKKLFFRYVQFTTATLILGNKDKEKVFLENVISYFKNKKIDFIMVPQNNCLFNIVPVESKFCKLGSYVINLKLSEEELWENIHGKHKNVIRKSQKNNLIFREEKNLKKTYLILKNTLKKSNVNFLEENKFYSLVKNIKNIKIFSVYKDDEIQGVIVVPYSKYKAYYLYGGSIENPFLGAMNFLHWETIKYFKNLGIRKYDFLGARLSPPKGSKLEGIQRFKSRFGCDFEEGYLWKKPINNFKYYLYCFLINIKQTIKNDPYKGDIIEQETKNNSNFRL